MSVRWMALVVLMLGLGGSQLDAVYRTVVRVEEDWEIRVASPDALLDLPQIVTVFGPDNPETGVHAVFELNHGTLPTFGEGGMQLQYWDGDNLRGYKRQKAPTEFATAGETVKFTTVTEIDRGDLVLSVTRGTSETFGTFGDESSLRIRVNSSLWNLNFMDLDSSIRHSRVTYGANHVSRFRRNTVRMYDTDGDIVATDSTVRDIR